MWFALMLGLPALWAGQASATAEQLESIRSLARTGAPELAISLIDRYQPPIDKDAGGWAVWERERIFMLQARERWAEVIARLKGLPRQRITASTLLWADEQLAQAYLKSADAERARRVYLQLLLHAETDRKHALWRRNIIETYLADRRDQDADRAMLRYQQDYRTRTQDQDDDSWPILRAQVLLRTGRAQLAEEVLPNGGGPDVELLKLFAGFESGSLSSRTVWKRLGKILKSRDKMDADQIAVAYALRARVAQRLRDQPSATASMERALAQLKSTPREHPLAVGGDDLWQAYAAYGETVANARQLLLGDDQAWYRVTDELFKKYPVQARSLLAYQALNAPAPVQRDEATRRLVKSLAASAYGRAVLPRLYAPSAHYPGVDAIPAFARYQLAEQALAEGDVPRASALVADLAKAPPGTDPFDWHLRRARILILAGRDADGVKILTALLRQSGALDEQVLDRFLQVVFDLQTIKQHAAAVRLFERLLGAELSTRHRREILFWTAESETARGNGLRGAQLYLRSAGLIDPFSMDPWAQTARFQAAEVLAKEGLIGDARLIYTMLLKVTEDEGRKAVLRQRLQKLLLNKVETNER